MFRVYFAECAGTLADLGLPWTADS